MSATPSSHATSPETTVLFLAFELSRQQWLLAFGTRGVASPRLRRLPARDLDGLQHEIALAKQRFGLPADTAVYSCYEAGRDGFWLDRYLRHAGIHNQVIDSASIEVDRRKRRTKSDRLDVGQLLDLLIRYHTTATNKKPCRVVHVPSVAAEDRRHLHRDLLELKGERTRHINRIKGLLMTQGLTATVGRGFAAELPRLRTWDGQALPAGLQQRLLREWERLRLVDQQIAALESERLQTIATSAEPAAAQVRRLLPLRGIGPAMSWLLVMELGWRDLRNRRQVGALAGLTPTPYDSGSSRREQGISKAGNRCLRALLIEIAWSWLRYQPNSQLTLWYQQRFASGAKRLRRIGIVALARKLLVQLWRYLQTGELPPGAELVSWKKLSGKRVRVGA